MHFTNLPYKIVFWGAQGAGKTSLLLRKLETEFSDAYRSTIGARFFTKDGSKSKQHFWDLGGNEIYSAMNAIFFCGSQLLVYSIDLSEDLNPARVRADLASFRSKSMEACIILLGTKSDVSEQKISSEQLRDLASELGITECFITSAKNDVGVNELFAKIDRLEADYVPAPAVIDEGIGLALAEPYSMAGGNRMFIAPEVDLPTHAILRKLPASSPLYNALDNLFRQIQMLPQAKRNIILNAADALVDALQLPSITSASATVAPNTTTDPKIAAIASFQTTCAQSVKKPMQKIILDSIGVVVSAAFFTLLVGVIGFGIGFALGAWTGPGVFITAILGASSAAAIAVAATSGTVGVIAGVRNGCRLFKPSPLPALLNAVAQEAKAFEPSSAGLDVVV